MQDVLPVLSCLVMPNHIVLILIGLAACVSIFQLRSG